MAEDSRELCHGLCAFLDHSAGVVADDFDFSVCQVFDQELEALQIETVQKETIRESPPLSPRFD